MDEKAKRARNAYMKKWRDANPDKVKANTARYWERQAAKAEAAEKEAGGNG
jgi:hypothetical protein